MFKILGWIIKLSLFSVAVLWAGDWIRWHGQTLAQHVRAQFSQAGSTEVVDYVRDLTQKTTQEVRARFEKKSPKKRERGSSAAAASTHADVPVRASAAAPAGNSPRGLLQTAEITDETPTQASAPARTEEKIPPSERQKLRALIHELNSSGE